MLETFILNGCINIIYNTPNVNNYRWVNIVVKDPYGMLDSNFKEITVPYIDPPLGGFNYHKADNYIYYWDEADEGDKDNIYSMNNWMSDSSLTFQDCPTDSRLQKKEEVEFITCLYNLTTNNTEKCLSWSLMSNQELKLINEKVFLPFHLKKLLRN